MLTDSHCHIDILDLRPYDQDVRKAVKAAHEKDVKYMLCPSVDIANCSNLLGLVETDDNLFAAIGTHPTARDTREPSANELIKLGQNKKVVCIGETGLDFYYVKDESKRERQRNLLRTHIQAANTLNKPLVIHSRESEIDMIAILKEEKASTVGGIIHCFTESLDMAQQAMDLGFYISFSGIITFQKADNLREIAKKIPLEKMLIETDSPYLAPVPVRGKSNEPMYLHYIAEYMAELLGVSYETFASQTTENFLRLCRI